MRGYIVAWQNLLVLYRLTREVQQPHLARHIPVDIPHIPPRLSSFSSRLRSNVGQRRGILIVGKRLRKAPALLQSVAADALCHKTRDEESQHGAVRGYESTAMHAMDLPGHTEAQTGKQTQTAVHHAPELLPAGKGLPIRVLILEDHPDMAESLPLVLSLDEGFAVEIVHDVATCLERLQASTALTALSDKGHLHAFDVLLIDMLLGAGHVGTEVLGAAVAIPHLDMPARGHLHGALPRLSGGP